MKTLKEVKRRGTGSLYLGPVKNANTKSVTYNSFGKVVKESINKSDSVSDVLHAHGYKLTHNDKGGSYVYQHPSGHRAVEVDDPNGRWHHYPAGISAAHSTKGYGGAALHKHLSTLHEGVLDKKVPVYHAPDKRGEYELVGHVHRSATSIGAAKLAGKKSARFEKVDGKYGWIAEGLLDKRTASPEELAKKHGVSLEHIEKQVEKGIKVEQEHTSNLDVAREIALDHLGEDPNYYFKLKKMEEAVDPTKLGYNKYANKFVKRHANLFPATDKDSFDYKKFGADYRKKHPNTTMAKMAKKVTEEVKKDDQVTIHYGAHAKESHRVTMLHGDGEVTIQPDKRRGRENRYPGGELKVPQTDLHKMNELHDEPDRIGGGMRGISGTEGANMTEEPRKTLKVSKAEWAHHTQHATAQYDTDGKPWIVKKDPSGAAVRIPVSITEDYPHRRTLRAILKEALPFAPEPKEKEVSKTTKTVKGVVKKDKKDTKDTKDSGEKLTIGKEKDKFEPDPVLTPVLSIANMPGGSVR